MAERTLDWRDELGRWLKPFLARLGHKARRQMCPLYVSGLIGPGDRKSVQPMAKRLALGACDQLYHFIAAGVWDARGWRQNCWCSRTIGSPYFKRWLVKLEAMFVIAVQPCRAVLSVPAGFDYADVAVLDWIAADGRRMVAAFCRCRLGGRARPIRLTAARMRRDRCTAGSR